jgi:hypothetical protein
VTKPKTAKPSRPAKKPSLADRLASLGEKAQSLHEPTEFLNERLRQAEKALASLNLGVTASVVAVDDVHLTWGKEQSHWGLFAARVNSQSAPGQPLLNCSRYVRVHAARALPKLLEALADKVDQDADAVHGAIEAVDEFLVMFGDPTK